MVGRKIVLTTKGMSSGFKVTTEVADESEMVVIVNYPSVYMCG